MTIFYGYYLYYEYFFLLWNKSNSNCCQPVFFLALNELELYYLISGIWVAIGFWVLFVGGNIKGNYNCCQFSFFLLEEFELFYYFDLLMGLTYSALPEIVKVR